MKVKIANQEFELKKEDIEKAMAEIEPEKLSQVNKYLLKIGNKAYPPKQVVSHTLGIAKTSFTSHGAYRLLKRFGFKFFIIGEKPPYL
jgi:hypothetical protein